MVRYTQKRPHGGKKHILLVYKLAKATAWCKSPRWSRFQIAAGLQLRSQSQLQQRRLGKDLTVNLSIDTIITLCLAREKEGCTDVQ